MRKLETFRYNRSWRKYVRGDARAAAVLVPVVTCVQCQRRNLVVEYSKGTPTFKRRWNEISKFKGVLNQCKCTKAMSADCCPRAVDDMMVTVPLQFQCNRLQKGHSMRTGTRWPTRCNWFVLHELDCKRAWCLCCKCIIDAADTMVFLWVDKTELRFSSQVLHDRRASSHDRVTNLIWKQHNSQI